MPVSSYTPSTNYIGLRFPCASEHLGVLNERNPNTGEPTEHNILQPAEPTEQEVFDPFKHTFTAADFEAPLVPQVVVTPVPTRYAGDTTRQHHTVLDFLAAVPRPVSVLASDAVTQQSVINWPPETNPNKNKKARARCSLIAENFTSVCLNTKPNTSYFRECSFKFSPETDVKTTRPPVTATKPTRSTVNWNPAIESEPIDLAGKARAVKSSGPQANTDSKLIMQAFPVLCHKAHSPGLQLYLANVSSLSLKARAYLLKTKYKAIMLAELHNTDAQQVRTFFRKCGFNAYVTPAVQSYDSDGNVGGECVAVHRDCISQAIPDRVWHNIIKNLGIHPHFAACTVKLRGLSLCLATLYLDGVAGLSRDNYSRLLALVTLAQLLGVPLCIQADTNIHKQDLIDSGWLLQLGLTVLSPVGVTSSTNQNSGRIIDVLIVSTNAVGIILQYDQLRDTPWSPHFANLATLSLEPTKVSGLALFSPKEPPVLEANQKLDALEPSIRSQLWEGSFSSANRITNPKTQNRCCDTRQTHPSACF